MYQFAKGRKKASGGQSESKYIKKYKISTS